MIHHRFFPTCLLFTLFICACQSSSEDIAEAESTENMSIEIITESLGHLENGAEISAYTLENASGIKMKVMNYGCIIMDLETPDRDGNIEDITLGYDNLQGYLDLTPYFGAIVGRYGNRIAKGRFELDGQSYELATNNDSNHLHGGVVGFDKRAWDIETFNNMGESGLTCSIVSPDGEEGYPGQVEAQVTYTLNDKDQLVVDYLATSDKATPINLTQHAYFNLSAFKDQDILGHEIQINADHITPVDDTLIPTGDFAAVEGTAFDFRTARLIGDRIDAAETQIERGGGYDHNFVLNGDMGELRSAARVVHPGSGRVLEVETTEPGMQFYSGNFLDGAITGKNGVNYIRRSGFCLETQHYPDSPNQENFPSTILRPGEKYESQTVFTFSTE